MIQIAKLIYLRLLNGIYLRYTVKEILELILLKSLVSRINKNKIIEVDNFIKISISNIEIVVISLPLRKDRRECIFNQFEANNLPFHFIEAISGKEIRSYINIRDNFSPQSFRFLSEGSVGCIMSHAMALKSYINSEKIYSLIFEDDVLLQERFSEKLNFALFSIPSDFDIIYLGSRNPIEENLRGWVSASFYIPLFPRMGQFAYIVSVHKVRIFF